MSAADLCLPCRDTHSPPSDAPRTAPALHTEDDALVALARQGETAALEALVERYRPRIYAFALSLVLRRDDAEDVTQETLIRMVRFLGDYESRGQFRSWVYRIAVNLCRDHARRTRRRPAVPLDAAQEAASPDDPQACVTAEIATAAAIARLPEKYRAVIGLHCLEGLTPTEIAGVLQRPVNLVRVQLWRARSMLVRELGDWLD